MLKPVTVLILTGIMAVQACGPAATPEQQAQRQHNIACATGTIAGAVIGGAIGNEFGSGSGQDILRAGGAGAGAVAGQSFAC